MKVEIGNYEGSVLLWTSGPGLVGMLGNVHASVKSDAVVELYDMMETAGITEIKLENNPLLWSKRLEKFYEIEAED